MGNGEYQRIGAFHLRCSFVILLLGPCVADLLALAADSQYVLERIPYEPWAHTGTQWFANATTMAAEGFNLVLLVQVVVWWTWREVVRPNWLIGLALVLALLLGNVISFCGFSVAMRLHVQESVTFFGPSSLASSVFVVPGLICMIIACWILTRVLPKLCNFASCLRYTW